MEKELLLKTVDYDPFATQPIQRVGSLIESQEEIWVSCLIGGEDANRSNNLTQIIRLAGRLDEKILHNAVALVVERHESLRMSFSKNGKYHMVYESVDIDFSILDLRTKSLSEQELEVQKAIDADAIHLFDLMKCPLIKFTLLKLDEERHIFLISAHQIIVDGWSFDLIVKDIGNIYSSIKRGDSLGVSYAMGYSQYTEEVNDWMQTKAYAEDGKYWENLFKGNRLYLELPTDKPRPENRTYDSARLDFELGEELLTRVRRLSARAKVSLLNTLLAAFEIYFHKLTGQKQFAIGVPASGQAVSGNFDLVGHCVHLLPIPCRIDPKLSYLAYLQKRKFEMLENFDHAKYTFSSLLKHLNVQRDNSRIPLVPLIINFESSKNHQYDFEGLELKSTFGPKKFETFENSIYITEKKDTLQINWQYNTNLYEESSILKMLKEYKAVLEVLVSTPEVYIADLGIVKNEFLQRISPWNATDFEYPRDEVFTKLVSKRSAEFPNKPAVSFRGKIFTYSELEKKSNQFANHLIGLGVGKGDIVGLCASRSCEMVVALLSIVKAGAAYLPLDPVYPKDRIEMMVEDANCRLFLISSAFQGDYSTSSTVLVLEELFDKLDTYASNAPRVELKRDDLVYVIYTSGSTGRPKGVQITHGNFVNFLLSMQVNPGISPKDKLLAVTTISFDIAGLELFLPLISGSEVVIADAEAARDGRILADIIEKDRITIMQATPATWRMMTNTAWRKNKNLKVLCGGEPLSSDLAEKILGNAKELWNMYGPTETTVWSLVKQIKDPRQSITIGRPIHNTQVYIVGESGELLAPGEIGEIWLGGDGVAAGYLNRPELTSEKFVPNCFEPEKGKFVYRTGDLGRFLPDGELVCLGRIDNQVKIRGYRIELGEIEERINQLSEVKESVVIAREDVPGEKKLAAYVVLHTKSGDVGKEGAPESFEGENALPSQFQATQLTNDQIKSWKYYLRESLPEYMIPSDWVPLLTFPKTPNNKVDRKALPKPFRSNLESIQKTATEMTALQAKLEKIWSRHLGVSSIGLRDDFFEMGGDSILAVEVVARIESELGYEISINSIFKHPTIETYCEFLESKNGANDAQCSLVPIKPTGTKPPLFIVHGVGCSVTSYYSLANRIEEDQPVFGFQAKGLSGTEEPHQSIEQMAAHYVSLMVKKNPNGPYNLAGYSFGGYVAFEMAKQLLEAGKEISNLILFDTIAEDFNAKKSFSRKLKEEFGKRKAEFGFLVKYPKAFIENKKSALLQKLDRKFKRIGFNSPLENNLSEKMKIVKRLTQNNHRMLKNYKLGGLDVEMTLFKVMVPNFYTEDSKNYGWTKYVGKMKVIDIPGHHNLMFKDDKVLEVMVKSLQECLK